MAVHRQLGHDGRPSSDDYQRRKAEARKQNQPPPPYLDELRAMHEGYNPSQDPQRITHETLATIEDNSGVVDQQGPIVDAQEERMPTVEERHQNQVRNLHMLLNAWQVFDRDRKTPNQMTEEQLEGIRQKRASWGITKHLLQGLWDALKTKYFTHSAYPRDEELKVAVAFEIARFRHKTGAEAFTEDDLGEQQDVLNLSSSLMDELQQNAQYWPPELPTPAPAAAEPLEDPAEEQGAAEGYYGNNEQQQQYGSLPKQRRVDY